MYRFCRIELSIKLPNYLLSNSVKVKWGKEVFNDVEANTDEEPTLFKAQLFALTGVQNERQKVMLKGATLKDTDWGNIQMKNVNMWAFYLIYPFRLKFLFSGSCCFTYGQQRGRCSKWTKTKTYFCWGYEWRWTSKRCNIIKPTFQTKIFLLIILFYFTAWFPIWSYKPRQYMLYECNNPMPQNCPWTMWCFKGVQRRWKELIYSFILTILLVSNTIFFLLQRLALVEEC